MALYGAETWDTDQKYIKSFEIWCWRMDDMSWMFCVKNEVRHSDKGERKILQAINRKKVKWTGLIRHRNCLLKHVMEGNIEGT
jgi:hypothetical protein